MGEVYLAKDTRLERKVAIKVLSEHLAEDQMALARFQREAKTLAALSHPNIVAIYDIGTEGNLSFVAMELLQGVTLRAYLEHSTMPWRRALEIASVIADAVAAAHSMGITHRDLKPDNIFLTSTGVVKVLDFGLARIEESFSDQQATIATPGAMTETGTIMGTAEYMSPEQARGKSVDNRTDIWAFGCVLFEMLTRSKAFPGETFSDTIAGLLLKEPDWRALPQDLPPAIKYVLRQCLKKNPSSRPDDLKSVKLEIEKSLLDATTPSSGVPTRRTSKPHLRPRSAKKRIKSLVVLPLANLSGDGEKEYFADGMTEALITGLAMLGDLRIISRTSAMRYKGTSKSLPEIANELNVDAVIEGSVLTAGQRVRITVQLISAATDTHLWAENYDRDLQDVLLLQSEVARAVAEKIQLAIASDKKKFSPRPAKVNPEAYEACLKARYHLFNFSPEHQQIALQYFLSALEKDPKSAMAYAGIGEVWLNRSVAGHIPSCDAIPKAKEALLRALEMDESLPEVHIALGKLLFAFEHDWNGAEREYQRAIQLNRNSAEAHFFLGDFLICVGRPEQGTEKMKRALELDPLNFFMQSIWGWNLVYLRRSDEAIHHFRKILQTEPNLSSAVQGLWGAFYQKGMHEEALIEAKKFFTILGDREIAEAMNNGYAAGGYQEAMRRAAEKLKEHSHQAHVPAMRIARLYAQAGETDQALDWLEKAYDQAEPPLFRLNTGWDWETLQDHPRFKNLLQRLNFLP